MAPIKAQPNFRPRGRIYFNGTGSLYPGWHLQYYVGSDLRTVRLHIPNSHPLRIALIEAAGFLGCRREQLQLEGDEWPSSVIEAD